MALASDAFTQAQQNSFDTSLNLRKLQDRYDYISKMHQAWLGNHGGEAESTERDSPYYSQVQEANQALQQFKPEYENAAAEAAAEHDANNEVVKTNLAVEQAARLAKKNNPVTNANRTNQIQGQKSEQRLYSSKPLFDPATATAELYTNDTARVTDQTYSEFQNQIQQRLIEEQGYTASPIRRDGYTNGDGGY